VQLSFKKVQAGRPPASLADLRPGEQGVLVRLELPEGEARRLMELGFLPGSSITAGRSAPGGDPRIFQVDGSEVALRRSTARCLKLGRTERPAVPKMVEEPEVLQPRVGSVVRANLIVPACGSSRTTKNRLGPEGAPRAAQWFQHVAPSRDRKGAVKDLRKQALEG